MGGPWIPLRSGDDARRYTVNKSLSQLMSCTLKLRAAGKFLSIEACGYKCAGLTSLPVSAFRYSESCTVHEHVALGTHSRCSIPGHGYDYSRWSRLERLSGTIPSKSECGGS